MGVALVCYVGVLVLLLLWRQGDPAFNFSIYEGTLFGPDFRISINLYTVLFILFFGIGYGAYYATADMPIPMVADCADYETYRSGKFIPGVMGTLFALVDKLVSSLSATVVGLAVSFIGLDVLPTKSTPLRARYEYCGYRPVLYHPHGRLASHPDCQGSTPHRGADADPGGELARKEAVAKGMSLEEAMRTITDETVPK
ncbi:MAG: MFS transporter [Flavonifractor plautii]